MDFGGAKEQKSREMRRLHYIVSKVLITTIGCVFSGKPHDASKPPLVASRAEILISLGSRTDR